MNEIRITPLRDVSESWSDFDENYLIGDDGHIYRRLKSSWYRAGYQQVRGYFGTAKQHTVHPHKAVALAYVEKPEGCTDVDHINNDKGDNRASNLQWLTHRDNMLKMHADRKERRANGKG